MRLARNLAPLLLAIAGAGSTLGLSFNFTYVDDAGGTFASRGWLDPNSLFQRNIRVAADQRFMVSSIVHLGAPGRCDRQHLATAA